METGIIHTHTLVVALYVLLMAFKTVLLLAGQKGLYATVNGKTKILRIVLEVLMLSTGAFLLMKSPVGTDMLHIVKYGLVVVATVLAIIASKKLSKPLFIASLLIFVYIFLVARTRSLTLQSEQGRVEAAVTEATTPEARGKAIYEVACERCHGADGDAKFRKAMSLKTSGLNDDAKAITIKAGRKMMPKFDYLTDPEIQDVVAYINSLK